MLLLIFKTTLSFTAVFLLGFLISRLFLVANHFLESLGLSFLLGSFFYTLILFVGNFIFDIPLTFFNSSVLLLFFLMFVYLFLELFSIKPFLFKLKIIFSKKNIPQIIAIFLFFLLFFVSFFYPVIDWDAVTLFDFRARIMLDTGFIKDTLFRIGLKQYPPFTSLLHYWFYSLGFKTAMPLYVLFWGSFGLTSYALLRRFLSPLISLIFALGVLLAPQIFEHSQIAYANLPYSIYLILGVFYLYFYLQRNKKHDLFLGLLLSLASLWSRNFPFVFVNLAVFIFVYLFSKKEKLLQILTIFLPLTLFAFIYLSRFLLSFTTGPAHLLFSVFDYTKWSILEYYQPFTLICLLLIFDHFKNKNSNPFYPLLIFGYLLTFVLGTSYLAVSGKVWQDIPDAARRMMLFFSPTVIMYLATEFKTILKKS